MNRHPYLFILILVLSTTLTSCELIEGIFKAGFWTAIILIVLVVGLIIWIFSRFRR